MFKTSISITNVDALLKTLNAGIIKKAGARTVRRAASAGKTEISKQVRSRFNLKKQDVDRKITVNLKGINNDYPEAKLTIYGDPISLTYFGPKQISGGIQTFISKNRGIAQKKLRRSKYSGVTVKILKSKQTKLPQAFLARGKGGIPQVFARQGKSRYPLRALKVITVQAIVKQPANMTAIKNRVAEQLRKEWAAQLPQAIKEAGWRA